MGWLGVMRMALPGWILLVAALGAPAGVAGVDRAPAGELIDWRWLREAMQQADAVEVLEGLPHPFTEPEERAAEKTRVTPLVIATELYYQEPLPVAADVKLRLRDAFARGGLFVPPIWRAVPLVKFCGGFHAAYAVRWLKGGAVLAAAGICFSCHEVLFTGGGEPIKTDLTKTGFAQLRSWLTPYRQNRPLWRHFDRLREIKRSGEFKVRPPEPVGLKP